MNEDIKNDITEMSKEFDQMGGFVTCEISVHKNQIDNMEKFINKNVSLKYGKWVFTECETCVGYNGEGYVHVSIERHETLPKIEKSSNFIKVI